MPDPLSTEQLLTLYKIAIEEYRFQVRLNWDRTVFYLTLNSGLITIAAGLLKIEGPNILNLFVALVFLVGLSVSIVGARNISTGHDYYRRTVVKKTLLEDLLGLTRPIEDYAPHPNLAIGTTFGQNDILQILHNTEKWCNRPLRRSITLWIRRILIVFCLLNILGSAGSLWLFLHPTPARHRMPDVRIVPIRTEPT